MSPLSPPAPIEYRLEGVSHTFPGADSVAVQNVHLTIRRGTFTALIGPSGCGKSTLLNMLAGLLTPSEGTVHFRDEEITGPAPQVGDMLQKPALLPWRTTLENILLPVEAKGGRRAARAKVDHAMELIETVGPGGFAHAHPWQLSGEMAQRAAICRMLITEPEIPLLDEPFGALDKLTREKMDAEIQRIALQRNATVVLVTHSIPESIFLADRVLAMAARPGRINEIIEVDLERPRTLDSVADPR